MDAFNAFLKKDVFILKGYHVTVGMIAAAVLIVYIYQKYIK